MFTAVSGVAYHTAKRALDVAVSLALLCLFSPVLLTVALLVAATSPGTSLYRQTRVGRGGREFQIWKFRTMRQDADQRGPSVTSADDRRITPLGRLLRQTKLDELPQLVNVLKGDMSLVGPRPQVPRFVAHFDPAQRDVALSVRPGITGPTALSFRHEEGMLAGKEDREGYYLRHILPVKLEQDVEYVRTCSFRQDLGVLAQTAWLLGRSLVRRACRLPESRAVHFPPTAAPLAD